MRPLMLALGFRMAAFQIKFWVPIANFETDTHPVVLRKNLIIDAPTNHEKKILADLKERWSNIIFSDSILRLTIVHPIIGKLDGH